MKKTLLSILFLFCCIATSGQSAEENIVQQFGNNLKDWCSTKDIDYRIRAMKLCDEACRVKDKIMEDFAVNSGLNLRDYVVSNYLNGIQKALIQGQVSISMSNVMTIPEAEQTEYSKEYTAVSCNIIVNGILNYDINDLFYIHVRKGKIVKIAPREEIIDQKTGKKKIKVDFRDIINDNETFGLTYNYGENWPIGFSINYSYSMFMISADIGVNLDGDKLYKSNLEMTDVMNFHKEDIEYDPLFFFTITPSIYFKYVSIGCGAGFLYMGGKKYVNSRSAQSGNSGEGISSTYSYGSWDESCSKIKFMLRPSIKRFIPLNRESFLSLSIGYDYAFGYKEKNGINCGLGLQWYFN